MWALWSVGIFCTDENVFAAGHMNMNKQCERGEQLAVQVVVSPAYLSSFVRAFVRSFITLPSAIL